MKLSTAITQLGAATIKALSFSGSPSVTGGDGDFARYVLQAGLFGKGSGYDPNIRASNPRLNSLVIALQRQQTNSFCESPPVIQRRDKLGHWQYETDHKILDLLHKPNGWWNGLELMSAVLCDITFKGNAYLFVEENGVGPKSLVWLPAETVNPCFVAGSGRYIDFYKYVPLGSGFSYEIPTKKIIHFRSEEFDPNNNRLGRSRLAALVPELAVDREDTLYSAAIARNMGIPGVVISPKDPENCDWDDATALKLEEQFLSRTSGVNAGRPLVMTEGAEIHPFAFKPSEMNSDRAIAKVEARICQAFGVHPSVAASVLGVENSKMATLKQAYEMFWEQSILPIQRRISATLTDCLLTRYETVTRDVRVSFDLREVRALQQDKLELSTMTIEQYRWGVIPRETAQLSLGYDIMDKGTFYTDTIAQLPSGGGASDDPDKNKDDGQKPKSPARDQKA